MRHGVEFTKSSGISFENWWKILIWTAEVAKQDWLLSLNKEDHRDGWEMDVTPEDELAEQLDAAGQDADDE